MNPEDNTSEILTSCQKQAAECNQESDIYKDITDGSLYKNYFIKVQSEHDYGDSYHITLMMSTDEAPVFKSTHASIWPLYACVLELPVAKR